MASNDSPSRFTDYLPVKRREYLKYTGVLAGTALPATSVGSANTSGVLEEASIDDVPAPTDLAAEYERNPTNLDPSGDNPPRLSWQLESDSRGSSQSAYRIRIASTLDILTAGDADVWDSGRVESARSTNIEFSGAPLEPDTTYYWTVRTWDENGATGEWSDPARFTTALPVDDAQWGGEWIGINTDNTTSITNAAQNYPAPLHEAETLGQSFTIDGSFKTVSGRFPTWGADNSSVTVSLYKNGPDGTLISSDRFTNIQDNAWISLEFDEPLPAGTYYFEQSESDGTVGWWSHTDDVLDGGRAYEDGEPVDGDRTIRVRQNDSTDPSPLVRTDVEFDRKIESARAHVVTLGYGELHVNGERIGNEQLNPAWTKYDDRVLYSTHDLTETVEAGRNAIGLWLGRGWYSKGKEELPSRIPSWEAFGSPRGLVQLNVTYTDGETESVTTGPSWTTTSSPITENDIYDGETYDARKEQPGWSTPGFDDGEWNPVEVVEAPSDDFELRPQRLPPITVTETLEPSSIEERDGTYLVDFGQNHAGWVELVIDGATEGDKITLEHAEVLDENGNIVTENLRSAEATDTYIASSSEQVTYEPRFTYHGFRYVRVTGYPGALTADDIRSKVVHTGFEQTGSFACSNDDLNQVQHNAVWGLRSNAMGHPTDCCQRDERFGWTGDVHQNARADLFNFDAFRYHEKWMRDHDDDQDSDGSQSDAIPHAVDWGHSDPNWAKTRVIVPWYLYLHTGDERVLADRYEGMRDYVDFWDSNAEGNIIPASMAHYGDWLAFEPPRSDPALFNTFAHYQTTDLFAKMAAVLGRDEDAALYREQAEAIAEAFNDVFFDSEMNSYGSGTQTTYALPLSVGIVPDKHEQAVTKNLVQKIRSEDGGKLQTGFIGTRPLLNTLVEHGHEDLAYNIVSQPERPGWVYMVRNGATTMWERWDSDDQIGSGMNSFNHRPWTLISEWFYRVLAGIDIGEPGFAHVDISPSVVTGLNWAEAETETIRGTVAAKWERTSTAGDSRSDDGLLLEVTIPGNATGTVRIPTLNGDQVRIREDGKTVWNNGNATRQTHRGVEAVSRDGDDVIIEVGSGEYSFELEQLSPDA
ncbi:family 78 glycoside hydrolase catalytic domain [Natrinema gelatinilyticum]|uniref:family 78 glycoside hydrolase catalytic domain n=1 Tax=Natrinema gelatinilyticum TaxID=2961571 RepID=UPI0020C256E9|nr:family 78 glycoside hydrolase catalytic domain [Natrinema gelatinilyticum]